MPIANSQSTNTQTTTNQYTNIPITKCLFPVAGYGTRFLPVTKAIPKEMLPILTKPLIQYGVEEAVEAGCITIAMVTSKHKKAIENFFSSRADIENTVSNTNKEKLMDGVNMLMEQCTFGYIEQSEMRGLGHAILTGEPLIGNEPFAVILPDDLCTDHQASSNNHYTNTPITDSEGVLSQMVAIHEQYPDHSIVAIEEVPMGQTDRYGVIAGEPISHSELDPGSILYRVTDMVEKPDPSKAPTNLAIIGRYILTPDIFDILRETRPGKGGEIQITDALLQQAKQGRVLAYKFVGKRFDCGQVEGFVSATNYFYKNSL